MGNWITALGQQLGTQAASTGLGTIMGLALEGHNDRRQMKQQTKLQNLQITGNKQMIDYQKMKDLEMWKETGPTGMTKQLKEAGLNPGLLYGMSGAGGATTGGSGSVTGANAPQGGKEIIESMGMSMQGAQLQLLNAQRKNIEADTANKEADTTNKPIQGANIAADTENKLTQNFILEIERDIKGATSNAAKAMILHQLRITYEDMEIRIKEGKMTQQQLDAQLALQKAQAAKIYIDNELTKAQTTLSGTENEKKKQEIEMLKAEIRKITDPMGIENWIEREKLRLVDKGINVAIISATLGAVLRFTGH